MVILLSTFVVFLVMIGALAVGLCLGRPPLSGSCGGVSSQCLQNKHPPVECFAKCRARKRTDSKEDESSSEVIQFSDSLEMRSR